MAGKFRYRVGSSRTKTRIPKGASSESNPRACRHRNAANAARLAANTSMAAVDDDLPNSAANGDIVLQQLPLQAMSIGDREDNEESGGLPAGAASMVSDGGLTRISAFTSCTNPTFDAVHRIWKSGSKMQNDVVTVLAAVAELIKEEKGEETDVEYFAALLTALESTSADQTARLAATAYLLNLVVKKVNREVVQKFFSRTLQILYTKLGELAGSEDAAVLKNLLSVLGVVLRCQPASVWNQSSTKMILVSVATFATHDKPWVRTMSRRVLRAVLTDPVTSLDNGIHPAAGPVGEFALSQLEQHSRKETSGVVPTRILCMLEGVMHKMPQAVFKQLAEAVLRLLAFVDGTVKCSALQCLYRVLQRQPSDAALPVETNAQLILAIRDFAPPVNDVAVTAYWTQALGEAHVCLTAKDSPKSLQLLQKTLEMFIQLFDVGHEGLAEVASNVVMRLVERCISTHAEMASQCVLLLDGALNLRSATVWRFVLRTIMKTYEECGEAVDENALTRSLTTLAQLRESDDCFCKGDLDLAVGAAVRYVGVGAVLRALPLNIDPDVPAGVAEFTRSWMVPVMRVNIRDAPLAIFMRYFLPLAIKMHKKVPSLDSVTAVLYSTIQRQLWELLPSFLSSPTDFEKCFPELAPVLGAALSERADLRTVVLSSLRSALRFALQPDAPSQRSDVMRRYTKNYLPILFNLYTSDEAGVPSVSCYDVKNVRMAALETVRLYVELIPEDLLERYAKSAIDKTHSEENSVDKKVRILDLLGALAKRANSSTLGKVFSAVRKWFVTDEAALQKKAFRILEEIFKRSRDSEVSRFFEDFDDEISNVITQPLESVCLCARAPLLSIYQLKLRSLSSLEDVNGFSKLVLDSVIRCLDKSHSTHARSNAFRCLVEICQRLIAIGTESGEGPSTVLDPVLDTVYRMATLQSGKTSADVSLNLARSTMVALNVMGQKYVRVLNASQLSQLMAHACRWVGDGRPAVRVLVIRLLRVLTQKLPDYALQQYKELLLPAIFDGQLTADVTQKVRKANRLLLEVMVDRFGVEILIKSTDKSDWLKQLKAIEKIRRRKERRAAFGAGEGNAEMEGDEDAHSLSERSSRTAGADTILDLLIDSDDENDSGVDSDEEERKQGGASKAGSVWLKEGDEDEMFDLLDRSAMIQKVTTVRPPTSDELSKRKKIANGKRSESVFKLAKDGRLVVEDLECTSKSTRKKRQREGALDETGSECQGSGKKARTAPDADDVDESVESDEDDDHIPVNSISSKQEGWKPGGRGIHRDLAGSSTDLSGGKRSQKNSRKTGVKKKAPKFEPYAYLPLRKLRGKSTEMRKLVEGARKGASKGSKGKRRRGGRPAA